MPSVGDIAKGKTLGYKSCGENRYIWLGCLDCGKERWVMLSRAKGKAIRCSSCSAKLRMKNIKMTKDNNPAWRGGRGISTQGYVSLWVGSDSPFASMRDKHGRIREHRLVVAQQIGRCLNEDEIVHHKNGIKTDNRLENLTLTDRTHHDVNTRVKLLQKEVRLLQIQVKNLTNRLNKAGIQYQTSFDERYDANDQ